MRARPLPNTGTIPFRRPRDVPDGDVPSPTEAALRALALRLQEVREEERKELAHEIHDVLGQELTMLKLDAVQLLGKRKRKRSISAGAGPESVDLVERIDRLMATVRRLTSDLRPPVLDYVGLADAMEEETARLAARTDLSIRFETALTAPIRDTGLSTAAFRILQESLTNVVRHARSRRVVVKLFVEEGCLALDVRDDGVGFDPAVPARLRSLGILGMRERAAALGGSLGIFSTPGSGTQVRLRIPLGPADQGISS